MPDSSLRKFLNLNETQNGLLPTPVAAAYAGISIHMIGRIRDREYLVYFPFNNTMYYGIKSLDRYKKKVAEEEIYRKLNSDN